MDKLTEDPARLPPEADLQFDIEGVDDTIHILADLFTRYGDIYRFYSPAPLH